MMEVATILTMLVLNIFLPTLDTIIDVNLVTKLYIGAEGWVAQCVNDTCERVPNGVHYSHPVHASLLLLPFLLNYLVCWYTFYREEKYKIYTFIFPLLNLYPQFEASRIVYTLYKSPTSGRQLKRIFDENIGLHEVFLEAVPTTLIITAIWDSASGYNTDEEFTLAFFTSVITATLGLARCLKNGVVRPLGPGGCLNGVLSCRYILSFFASGFCLVTRGMSIHLSTYPMKSYKQGKQGDYYGLALACVLLYLPQAILAIFSSLNLRSKSSLKIITRHPSILLLPVFTFFTFSKLDVSCSGGESRVRFSKKFSWINIGVSAVGFGSWMGWIWNSFTTYDPDHLPDHPVITIFYQIVLLSTNFSLFVLSALLTLLFLHLDRLCCCCSCCLVPAEEISVYDPDTDQRFLLKDGEMVKPPGDDAETGHTSSSQF